MYRDCTALVTPKSLALLLFNILATMARYASVIGVHSQTFCSCIEVSLLYHYLGNKQLATSEENRARQLFGVKLYFNCKTLFYAYCRSTINLGTGNGYFVLKICETYNLSNK